MKRFLVVVWLVVASTAHAQDEPAKQSHRAVVDRVDLEPSTLTGYGLRVYLSALALEGGPLDLTDSKSVKIKLYVGSSELKAPYALGRYDATKPDTAIVIMVQSSLDYNDALPMIAEALDRDLLANLGDHTQVAVMTFGDSRGSGKLGSLKNARSRLALTSDNSVGDPTLLDTLDSALSILRRAKTTPVASRARSLRKLVIVVGDGRDQAGDRDRVTRAGKRADKDGVRIHTIAFSPSDVRRPMLTLGELSKRSFGTFRWVRKGTQDSWHAAFDQLREEINKQYVLTFFVGASDELAGKRLHIVTTGRIETTSNEVKIPSPTCGGTECTTGYCANDTCMQYRDDSGRGVLGWIVLVGGIVVGGLVLLGAIGYVITKKQQRGAATAVPGQPTTGQMPGHPMPGQPMPGQPAMPGHPAMPRPGFLPNGRPIPSLLVISGPRTGERHMLFNGFLIGKQPGCHLLFEDQYTSSQHAQIGMDANGFCKLYDRGSTNGTYINGVRVAETALQHGAVIKIGATEMRFLQE